MQLQVEANAFSVLSCVYVIGMVLVWFAPKPKGARFSKTQLQLD
jgi:hypothetical protein